MDIFEKQVFLLAEDDEDDVFLMQTAFPKAGLTNPLRVVPNGEELMAYLAGTGDYQDRERHPLPVVVLLDLKLPGKDGFEVLEWIQQQSFRRQMVVVMLTASSRSADAARAYTLGADFYLTKPGKFDDLVELTRCLHYWVRLNHFARLSGQQGAIEGIHQPASLLKKEGAPGHGTSLWRKCAEMAGNLGKGSALGAIPFLMAER